MSRADYMTEKQKKAMGRAPRLHNVCKARTGVMRPGKTAHERAKNGDSK